MIVSPAQGARAPCDDILPLAGTEGLPLYTAPAPLQVAVTCGVGGDGGQCGGWGEGAAQGAVQSCSKCLSKDKPVLFINWFSGL